MAKTITQLPDATVVNGADELIVQQGGVTKRATKTEVINGIVNSNVDAAAAIAGTKIAPNFGSQNVVTTGSATAADFRITGTKTTALINYLGTQTIVTPDANDWRTSIRIASASDTTPDVIEFWANNGQRAIIDASGNVGIGTSSPNAAALLDVSSTTQGFLPPRMTTAQRDAITSPPAGLMVYNTTTNKLNFYNGTAWEVVTSS